MSLDSDASVSVAVPPAAPFALKVLVVDDGPVERRIVAAVLESRGHAVAAAADGAEALALFPDGIGGGPFDAVVLDLGMPGVDGLALAAALRQAEGERGVPLRLVALSGLEKGGSLTGIDCRLGKPINPLALAAAVEGRSVAAPAAAALAGAGRPVFDAGEALRRARGRRTFLAELIRIFLADAAAQSAAIRTALAIADLAVCEAAAHRLKGSAMNISAWRVADAAREMEERVRARQDTTDLLPRLDAEIARVRGVLEAFLPGGKEGRRPSA